MKFKAVFFQFSIRDFAFDSFNFAMRLVNKQIWFAVNENEIEFFLTNTQTTNNNQSNWDTPPDTRI